MSLPRDRRVVESTRGSSPQLGVAPRESSSTAPQVTLEPLTSFKRSLEELGFPADSDELGQTAESPIPLTGLTDNTDNTNNPSVPHDRATSPGSNSATAVAAGGTSSLFHYPAIRIATIASSVLTLAVYRQDDERC